MSALGPEVFRQVFLHRFGELLERAAQAVGESPLILQPAALLHQIHQFTYPDTLGFQGLKPLRVGHESAQARVSSATAIRRPER